MRVIKGIQTSLVAMGVSALLIGCGGGGGSSSGSLTTADPVLTISGVVSDGPLYSAQVYIDLDEDGVLDANEPSTTSDSEGNYVLNAYEEVPANILVRAEGGVDTGTDLPFEGSLEARQVADKENLTQMITPLTTLESNGLSEDEIRTMFPEIPAGDLDTLNPNESDQLERAGVIVHSTMGQMCRAVDGDETTTSISRAYQNFARGVRGRARGFNSIHLAEIIAEASSSLDSTKSSTIASMIMEVTQEMRALDLSLREAKEQLRELQIAALEEMDLPIEEFVNDMVDGEQFVERARDARRPRNSGNSNAQGGQQGRGGQSGQGGPQGGQFGQGGPQGGQFGQGGPQGSQFGQGGPIIQ